MPNKSLPILCLLALMPLSTVAQKANFTDASAPGSPLQLSGEIASYTDTETTLIVNGEKRPTVVFAIHAKNVSSKEILAYSLEAPSLGFSRGTYDHYFKAGDILSPGDVETETLTPARCSVTHRKGCFQFAAALNLSFSEADSAKLIPGWKLFTCQKENATVSREIESVLSQ